MTKGGVPISCAVTSWEAATASPGCTHLASWDVWRTRWRYRWRKEYGGLRLDQAKRLKALEQENTQLKKLVADQALDNMILKEVASGNF